MKAQVETFCHRPLFSIIMPTYNTPDKILRSAIDSVRQQVYPHWELCIADDASTAPHLRKTLEKCQRKDSRIKVVFRSANGHISAATNSALELATGEFVTFLDHDDILRPHALYMVAQEINCNPDVKIIYSDEDKIDAAGHRFDPYFKPDWNPDLQLSQNYLCHLSVYHSLLVRELGGVREGFEGSQDWDLALRATACVPAADIRHIPLVLYHWRSIPGSTAHTEAEEEKNYALTAALKSVADHLRKTAQEAVVEITHRNYIRVKWKFPQREPSVDLIIPTRNRLEYLRRAVTSILDKTDYGNYKIVVVDNDSDDPETLEFLKNCQYNPHIRVIKHSGPFNFSQINNQAVADSRAEIVALINNDIEIINGDWLREMASHAIRPEIGAVGAKLYYPNDTIQHAGVIVGLGGVAGHCFKHFPRESPGRNYRAKLVQNLSAVTAACLLIRRRVYLEVGGLDEKNLTIAFNDVDFCLRVRKAGYRNLFTPYAELFHYESVSRGHEDTPEKQRRFADEVRFMKKCWGDALVHDPAYNPNLTLKSEDSALAFPPRVKHSWKLHHVQIKPISQANTNRVLKKAIS